MPTDTQHVSSGDKSIDVRLLRPGMRLSQDLTDQAGVLLLASGTAVSDRFLELLSRRRIQAVKLAGSSRPTQLSRGPHGEAGKRPVAQPSSPRSTRETQHPKLSLPDLRAEVMNGLERHADASNLIIDVCDQIRSGNSASVTPIRQTVGQFVYLIGLDQNLLALVFATQKSKNEYLFDHCVNVAILSMSIAAQLGWSQAQIIELGIGAMLQDVGMLSVPETLRLAPRPISPNERCEIERHPFHTLATIEKIRGLPEMASFIAHQSHERGDRSGYPKKRSGMYIHAGAKIAAVADTYTAMSRARPHRNATLPYEAVKTVLVAASQNKLDRAIAKAFLDAVSLFPIGSFVELSDGTRGQVIRANPGLHTRPVIDACDGDGKHTGNIIDLSEESQRLTVTGAVESPHSTND